MNSTDIFSIFTEFFPWGFLKVAILVMLLMYLVFAAVMVRQEQLMAKVVEIPFSPVLRIVALAHLVSAAGLFLLAIILL